jgi:hypothetical protein
MRCSRPSASLENTRSRSRGRRPHADGRRRPRPAVARSPASLPSQTPETTPATTRTHARTHTRRHGCDGTAPHRRSSRDTNTAFHGTSATGTCQQYTFFAARASSAASRSIWRCAAFASSPRSPRRTVATRGTVADTYHRHCGHARAHEGTCTPSACHLASRRTLAQRRVGRTPPPSFAAIPTLARCSTTATTVNGQHVHPRQWGAGHASLSAPGVESALRANI